MKKPLLLALCLLSLLSCKKETGETRYDQVLYKNSGTASATLNGSAWPTSSKLIIFTFYSNSLRNCFDMQMEVFDENKSKYQTLYIGSVAMIPQTVNPITAQKYFASQGLPDRYNYPFAMFSLDVADDATENEYDILPDSSGKNAITVASYDGVTKQVQGSFHFTMVRSDKKPTPAAQGFPDTLRFTNGVFTVQIKE